METFSALLALCVGNSPVTGEFPHTKASDAELWCFFDLRLSKQSWDWWFETPSCSLWRHCNEGIISVLFVIVLHILWPPPSKWVTNQPVPAFHFDLVFCNVRTSRFFVCLNRDILRTRRIVRMTLQLYIIMKAYQKLLAESFEIIMHSRNVLSCNDLDGNVHDKTEQVYDAHGNVSYAYSRYCKSSPSSTTRHRRSATHINDAGTGHGQQRLRRTLVRKLSITELALHNIKSISTRIRSDACGGSMSLEYLNSIYCIEFRGLDRFMVHVWCITWFKMCFSYIYYQMRISMD